MHPEFVNKLFRARALLTPEDQDQFLAPRLKDLRDPFLFQDMERAVARLLEARATGELVTLYGDFDLDGTTGVALLETGLKRLGFRHIEIIQPKRISEGYGVHIHLLEKIHQRGGRLVVTVDVGITALEAARYCKANGIDFIITDHHLPGTELPQAYALINANSGRCPSELCMLSGAGVAFYLVLALRKALREKGLADVSAFDPKELLDCLVIGTLTDITPLTRENRILMKHGLVQLARTKRPALLRLVEATVPGSTTGTRPLTSQDVGFSIAPKLNALSRLEMGLTPLEIFRCEDEQLAEVLIETVFELNDSRRNIQAEALADARAQHLTRGLKTHVWVWSADYHKGVIGLVATQLAREFQVPAIVGSVHEDTITASARLPEGSAHSLLELFAAASTVLIQAGGHREAGGLKVHRERAEELNAIWSAFLPEAPAQGEESAFEFESSLSELAHPMLLSYLDQLEPYGKSWPVPLVAVQVVILERSELRGGHLRLTLGEPALSAEIKLEALSFNPSPDLQSLSQGEVVNLVVEPRKNHWKGRERLQLLIRRRL